MKIFLLPDLGEGLTEAEIHQWYVNPGDHIHADQPLVSMETAKAVVDVPAPFSGTISKLFGNPGDIVNTGKPLIGFVSENNDNDEYHAAIAATVVGNLIVGDTTMTDTASGIDRHHAQRNTLKALPAVRALAKQLDIDLAQLTGTGHEGQITAADVKKAYDDHSHRPAPYPAADFTPLQGVRRSMAQCMSQSHQQVAPVTIMDDADIDCWPQGTDITVRTLRALQYACTQEPALNAWYDGYRLTHAQQTALHVGLAMDSDAGLFAPVLKHVAEQSDETLREQINQFKIDVAERRIAPDALHGATITLSNVGVFAARYATPIVVPPTVAIIAMGKIRQIAIVVEDQLQARRVLPLSLTFDHRIVTGGEATRFLAAMIEKLQEK
jgi:2-oxoisovalerate dehydrogenase E2 component (dihydrolipoyl transacylase)